MIKKSLLIALILSMLLSLLPALAQDLPLAQFGTYKAQADGSAEPILWRVLKNDGEGVLLLSELILDTRAVQAQGRYQGFESSQLQAWLQEDFFTEAFSPQEQAWFIKEGGKPYVTLPSVEELRKKDGGFFEAHELGAKPTAYARAQGLSLYAGGYASYWTRNPSVSTPGNQRRTLDQGTFGHSPAGNAKVGVRPLILLLPGILEGAHGQGSVDAPLMPELSGRELAAIITPSPVPQPTPNPSSPIDTTRTATLRTEEFPPLTDEGFLPPGVKEFVVIDEAAGKWLYANQDLRLIITRHEDKSIPLRYLTAEIFVRPGAETLKMYSFDKDNMMKDQARYLEKPVNIAKQHNLVFAMDGDYFIYRIGRLKNMKIKDSIGIIIRDYELLVDAPATERRNIYPPLDHVALFADGDMKVFKNTGITSQELIEMGARDVLSFGPYLIKDGVVNTTYKTWGNTLQPRAALGMVEKGHYYGVIIEGRIGVSKGMTCLQVAALLEGLGCKTAFNLDGGWTSAMIFMGKQLNQLDNRGVRDNARTQNEVMGIGFTDAYTQGTAP